MKLEGHIRQSKTNPEIYTIEGHGGKTHILPGWVLRTVKQQERAGIVAAVRRLQDAPLQGGAEALDEVLESIAMRDERKGSQ